MIIEYFLDWVESAPVAKRKRAAGALVRACLSGNLTAGEYEDVEAALTTLTEDPAPSVRLELARSFGAYPGAPRHIMATLAGDSLDVSVTVLSQSPVFHDAELAGFARTGSEKQQIAIACRPWLSGQLVAALSEEVCRDAAYALLVNPASGFTAETLHCLALRFGTDTEIRNLLTAHECLAPETRLLLIEKLGEALGSFVTKRNWVGEKRAVKFVSDACERASIIFTANADDQDVRSVVQVKIEEEKLTVSYLLRALCMGNIALFAHALSELSGQRQGRIEAVLNGGREAAFKAVYDRAGLPPSAFGVFARALSVWRRLLSSEAASAPYRLPYLVTREVLGAYAGGEGGIADDLLVLLRKLAAETARESAKLKASQIASRKQPEPDSEEQTSAPQIELQVEPAIDMTLFSESLQQELEAWEEHFSVTAAPVGNQDYKLLDAAAIAPANEDCSAMPVVEDMYDELYGLSDEEIIDGFSRAA